MKNLNRSYKAIILAAVAVFSTVLLNPVMASANQSDPDPSSIKVKYVGMYKSNPVFKLEFNNAEEGSYTVIVKDEYGTVLYKERLSGKNITRTYRIATEEVLSENALQFEVRPLDKKKSEVFSVDFKDYYTREVAINKL